MSRNRKSEEVIKPSGVLAPSPLLSYALKSPIIDVVPNDKSQPTMTFFPTTFLAPLLALLSLYAAQKSYIAITNLLQYEERTKKAARHFDKAADDLYKTRVTQASGAAAVRIHCPLCKSYLAFLFPSLHLKICLFVQI